MLEAFDKNLLADYSGTCDLITNMKLDDVHIVVKGDYRCIQGSDTAIYLYAKIPPDSSLLFLLSVGNPNFIIDVRGDLTDEEAEISNNGGVIHTALFQSNLISVGDVLLSLETFEVKYPVSKNSSYSKMIIPITNFEFKGLQTFLRPDGTTVNTLALEVAGIKFEIFPKHDFSVSLPESLITRPCKVTSYIEVDLTQSYLPYDELLKVVDNVCVLLSFARGTWITWPFYQLLDQNGKVVKIHHRKTFTSNFGIRPLKVMEYSEKLKNFIETSYEKFVHLETEYGISQTIKILAEAKSMSSMGEINALTVTTAVDILRARWADKNGMSFIFEKSFFSKITKLLQHQLSEILMEFFNISQTLINEILPKLSDFNRYSFRTVLVEIINKTKADLNEAEIRAFIESRNKLVHQGRFKSSTPQDRFRELLSLFKFADNLILGLLGYKKP